MDKLETLRLYSPSVLPLRAVGIKLSGKAISQLDSLLFDKVKRKMIKKF